MCDVNEGQLERLFLHTVTRQVKKIGMKTTLQLGGIKITSGTYTRMQKFLF